MFLIIIIELFCNSALGQDISFATDIKTLSELPLEKLLQIKKTFYLDDSKEGDTKSNSSVEVPQALALQSKKSPKNRESSYSSYHYEEDHSKKDKKSIQSIFQISVTTLAFLAFGGYLICLLVQAVKGKTYSYDTSSATQVMSALLNAKIQKRRTTRAPQRLQQQKPIRPTRPSTSYRRRKPRPKREILTDSDLESMYYTLIDLSEGYTRYHTEDYLKYNYSSNYFL